MEGYQNEVTKMHRQDWIDVLRGFTMLLVIYWHVSYFTFSYGIKEISVLNRFFYSFRMPMFFFISGFIAYKGLEYWDSKYFTKQLFKKAKVQLIPTIVFFIALTFMLGEYYKWIFPGGYWFTLTLFEIFLIYYSISLFCHVIKKSIRNYLLIITVIILYIIAETFNESKYVNLFLIDRLGLYLLFFCIGLGIRKEWDKVKEILSRKGPLTFLFIIVFLINLLEISDLNIPFIVESILIKIYQFCFVLIIFNFFFKIREYWSKDMWLCRTMKFVGRRTLDLYMLHYFFLFPQIDLIASLLEGCDNMILELLIVGTWTIVIAALSLLFSGILRSSPIMAEYLFGVKKRQSF